jgi:adenosine deaminase
MEHATSERKRPELTQAFLKSLPKTDLHVHLDGSLRVETILELADKYKVKLPADNAEALRNHVIKTPENCKSLPEYLEAFDVTCSVLQDPEALTRVAYELAEDCAAENVRYFEVRYSPILHQRKDMKLTTIVESVLEGLREAEKKFPVRSGVIICGMRHLNPSISIKLAELTVAYKNKGVVAFDLAGAEEDNPAKKHREAFYLILNNNINCTAHAGESYGPPSIHQAIHHCGAHRVGHGTRLREDGDLLNYINDHRIPIECCVISNLQTHAVKTIEDHPIRFYFDYGLRVTVNTDNRLVSDTSVTKEYETCAHALGFNADEIRQLALNGFKSAFLPHHQKAAMLRSVVREMDALYGYVHTGLP